MKPYPKTTKAKKGLGGVAQMVEQLPSKPKAVCSNPSISPKKIYFYYKAY
jgi:hypothetical protein